MARGRSYPARPEPVTIEKPHAGEHLHNGEGVPWRPRLTARLRAGSATFICEAWLQSES
jgi:hypothetical protein